LYKDDAEEVVNEETCELREATPAKIVARMIKGKEDGKYG